MTMHITLLSTHTSPLAPAGTGDGGGLNVYVREVARRLADRGHGVQVLTRRSAPDQPDAAELAPGVVLRHVDAGPPAPVAKEGLPSLLCGFAMQARRLVAHTDVLHSHYWLSGWVARRLASAADLPFVHTFHTIGVMKNQALAPGDVPEPALRLEAERRIAQDAARVLALTCGEGRLLHRNFGMSGSRITMVPAGVDVDLFRPEPGPRDDEVTAAVPADVPVALFVGRLQPLKGPDVAIEALARLRQVVPDARLVVVGGVSGAGEGVAGPDELDGLADRLGIGDAVTILPAMSQDRLAAWYRRAQVVVVPSRSETFGLVALEAQACATPVVAAQVGGLEYVVRDGGTLVAGHDPATWADAMAAPLTDPALAARTGAAGRAWARASSWDATVDRLEHVYGAVAAQPLAAIA